MTIHGIEWNIMVDPCISPFYARARAAALQLRTAPRWRLTWSPRPAPRRDRLRGSKKHLFRWENQGDIIVIPWEYLDMMIWYDMMFYDIYIYTYDYYININISINSNNENWWGLLDPHQAIPLPIFFFYSLLFFPLCFSILLNQFSPRHQAARRCFASFTAIGCPSGLWAWMLSWELLGKAATDSRKMKQLHMYEHATALNVMVGGMSHQHSPLKSSLGDFIWIWSAQAALNRQF